MKISVCGKGGSGKSTIVSLLASEARARGYHVLVVDSDESNSGLFRMLDFDQLPVPLMELVEGKKSLKYMMRQLNVFAEAEIIVTHVPEQYVLRRNGLKLVVSGKTLQSVESRAWSMAVLSREFLKKLALKRDELVIVDVEAGAEYFGRGNETSIDIALIVVEPSLESVNMADKMRGLVTRTSVSNVWAILNKVPSDEVAINLYIELRRRHIAVLGCLHFAPDVFSSSMRGNIPANGRAVGEVKDILGLILARARHPYMPSQGASQQVRWRTNPERYWSTDTAKLDKTE